MFGRRNQADLASNGPTRNEGWLRSDRAQRRDRECIEAERISDLRWQWHSACSVRSLAHVIYTPSGVTRAVPLISQVDLGPPVSFVVRLRAGQSLGDFIAAAPSIAPFLNAAELRITPLAPQWLRVVLVPKPAPSDRSAWPKAEARV
jgi:hypothetical protein